MTPRDRVDWRQTPAIPQEYRDLWDRLEREAAQARLRYLAAQIERLTVSSAPVPPAFQRV